MATCGPRRQSVEAEKDLKVSSVQFSLVSFSLFPPSPLPLAMSLYCLVGFTSVQFGFIALRICHINVGVIKSTTNYANFKLSPQMQKWHSRNFSRFYSVFAPAVVLAFAFVSMSMLRGVERWWGERGRKENLARRTTSASTASSALLFWPAKSFA